MEQNMEQNISSSEQCKNDIAIGSIPKQAAMENLIPIPEALLVGTIFKELHKPFYLGGDARGR